MKEQDPVNQFGNKFAKMRASVTEILFCSYEVPVLIQGQNVSSITYLDLFIKNYNCNCTFTAYQPLYTIVVKIEDGKFFQQYGEKLKKLNNEIYHWPMRLALNASDQDLYLNHFSQSQKSTPCLIL